MNAKASALLIDQLEQAIRQALIYVDGMTQEDFLADLRTQQAVVLNLLIMGESATKLMDRHPEVAARAPDIAWRSMRGMRNRIAHGYHEIDMEIVWETLDGVLPALARDLAALRA